MGSANMLDFALIALVMLSSSSLIFWTLIPQAGVREYATVDY